MRRIYDITCAIEPSLVVWPGDTPCKMERIREVGEESEAAVSRIVLSSHAGTHVDAPAHFIAHGHTVEQLNLDILIGEALVVAIDADEISYEALAAKAIPEGTQRVIFKTGNSDRWRSDAPFREDYVGVTTSGARWLIDRGIKLVGLDYLSAAAHPDIPEVHQLLLGQGVVLLETLDLRGVEAGTYELICLPLKLAGADGAPARAVLVREDAAPKRPTLF